MKVSWQRQRRKIPSCWLPVKFAPIMAESQFEQEMFGSGKTNESVKNYGKRTIFISVHLQWESWEIRQTVQSMELWATNRQAEDNLSRFGCGILI